MEFRNVSTDVDAEVSSIKVGTEMPKLILPTETSWVDDEIDAISGSQAPCRYFEIAWAVWVLEQKLSEGVVLINGCGQSAVPLMAARRRYDVHCLDSSAAAVTRQFDLSERGPSWIKMHPRGGVLTELPYETGMFDMVIAISSLAHVCVDDRNADKAAFAEVKRVLKPGGVFFWTLPVGKSYVANRYEGVKRGDRPHPPERVYTPTRLATLTRNYDTLLRRMYTYDSSHPELRGWFVDEMEEREFATKMMWAGVLKGLG